MARKQGVAEVHTVAPKFSLDKIRAVYRRRRAVLSAVRRGYAVKLWGIGEKIRQTLGRTERRWRGRTGSVRYGNGGSRLICAGWIGGPNKIK